MAATTAAALMTAASLAAVPSTAVAADNPVVCTGETKSVYGSDGYVWTRAEACFQVRDRLIYPVYRFQCQYSWGGRWYNDKTCTVRMQPGIQPIENPGKNTVTSHLVTGSGTGEFDVSGDRGLSCDLAVKGIALAGTFNANQYWDSSPNTNPHGELPVAHVHENVCD
ncbi:hypothetical protein ACIA6E_18880 [Streptomyces sp. NPDC051815]|uniref:hypothetical protein n=1 Tax=Streptomyces sp. NPDC051815 TaxID=3365674 RepID=UPI0037AF67EA